MYCTFKYTKRVFNSRHSGHISTPITITMKIFPVVLEFFHTSTLLLVCIMSDLRSSTTQAYLVVVYSFPKHEWQMHFKKKLIKQKWNKFHTTVTNRVIHCLHSLNPIWFLRSQSISNLFQCTVCYFIHNIQNVTLFSLFLISEIIFKYHNWR